jgi:hypothetical protein
LEGLFGRQKRVGSAREHVLTRKRIHEQPDDFGEGRGRREEAVECVVEVAEAEDAVGVEEDDAFGLHVRRRTTSSRKAGSSER